MPNAPAHLHTLPERSRSLPEEEAAAKPAEPAGAPATGGAPAWWPLVRFIALWALTWAMASMFTQQCIKVWSFGNDLSDIADPYSEANAIKSAENYAVNGFLSNKGL